MGLVRSSQPEGKMPIGAKLYILTVILTGSYSILWSDWSSHGPLRYVLLLIVTVGASIMKVRLPGILGTMSVNFLLILIGIIKLGPGEAIIVGCTGALVQCVWRAKTNPRAIQTAFSTMSIALAINVSYQLYHWPKGQVLNHGSPVLLLLTSFVYFLTNTSLIATVVALTERKSLGKTWNNCYFWSFPFYLVGGALAWIVDTVWDKVSWQAILLLIPVIYFIHRSYRVYLKHLEDEKRHVEEMAALHLRTIEALALAIEAKDHTTRDHLSRVQTYAVEIGKEIGLTGTELDALRAAALLHDIGKLAVPEHIISKPGKLTAEEFEKMKIHPVVGAEILERVNFPYPVVPIVRAHHELWDGSGYPDGLKGEAIPIGARILAVVDCFDAMASDRQYRQALPLDDAMEHVARLAGTSLDPDVVTILKRRYIELERIAMTEAASQAHLSTDVKIEKGYGPAAGFESGVQELHSNDRDFLSSIAAARQEVQLLFETTQDIGNSLSLDETVSVVAARLKRMIPYDAIVVHLCRNGRLLPEYTNGESYRLLSTLQVPMGQGMCGWVAQTGKPIINGDPGLDSQYLSGTGRLNLRAALSVPLVGWNGTLGVLTLYRTESPFSTDHVRILMAVVSKISLSIANAMKYSQVESSATTDYLTGLPNARSLFLRLDSELSRCRRTGESVTVLVCDLDGFKQVNDVHGHLEGNRVLRAVADALRSNCREYDYVARMGGDEFVILLTSSGEPTRRRIEEFTQVVSEVGITIPTAARLSVSVGEASYPSDGDDAEQLLAAADRRMYKTKQDRASLRSTRIVTVRVPEREPVLVQ
jgi:diguanylate cyclase (GGDEF)-like protein/putative nucleotidyltransferase with HDIG domain